MTVDNKDTENEINRLLKIIEEKDRQIAEARAKSKDLDAEIANSENKIQELERINAALASLALSAKKAEHSTRENKPRGKSLPPEERLTIVTGIDERTNGVSRIPWKKLACSTCHFK